MKKIIVSEAEAGERLDKFLVGLLSQTRSQVQKLIKSGSIAVNDKVANAHYLVQADDRIAISEQTRKKAAKASPREANFKIMAETDDYLVIDKPAGLLMHGTQYIREPNLADLLVSRYPQIAKVGEDPYRPGIIHRIDKDVSGLVLAAKTQAFFEHAKEQFQKRTIAKKYTALVHGQISPDSGLIDFPIERSASGHKMAARPKGSVGRKAESEFEVIKRFHHFTLVKVTIKTGRTHQIRAHLAAFGAPILGDNLYGTRQAKDANKKIDTKRVYLVSDELAFTNLSGEQKQYKLDLPKDFSLIMAKLK